MAASEVFDCLRMAVARAAVISQGAALSHSPLVSNLCPVFLCIPAAVFDFDNWVIAFPRSASEYERALLLTAVMQTDYTYFSRKGGDN